MPSRCCRWCAKLDDTRVVMLNSGRYDSAGFGGIASVAGLDIWPRVSPSEPWVGINKTNAGHPSVGDHVAGGSPGVSSRAERRIQRRAVDGSRGWQRRDGDAIHRAGGEGDHRRASVAQWPRAVRRPAQPERRRQLGGARAEPGRAAQRHVGLGCRFRQRQLRRRHDGRGRHGQVRRRDAATTPRPTSRLEGNPHGVWSYGQLAPGAAPDAATFALYRADAPSAAIGSIANPGSDVWEDTLSDQHRYPRVPHTGDIIQSLRTLAEGDKPVFLTEYGIGSAVDLCAHRPALRASGSTGDGGCSVPA